MTQSKRMKRAPQRLSGWRAVIDDYIRQVNQAEIEHDGAPLAQALADAGHLERASRRLVRTGQREKQRLAASVKHETKGRLLRASEAGNEAAVLLCCEHQRTLNQRGSLYVERRHDYERVWVQNQGGRWQIVRIEPVIAERRPQYGRLPDAPLQDDWLRGQALAERSPGVPYLNVDIFRNFTPHPRRALYHRDLAVAYADRWWNESNPEYEEFEVNCTNYISQCLFAGRAPMDYTGRRETGWWYKGRDNGKEWWSYSWAVSNALYAFLSGKRSSGLRAESVAAPEQLSLGDVIVYDWNGDGRFQHSTIVTAFDVDGMPLVNANTVASRHRYWDYRDSYAWTEQTQYRFFHIADQL